MLRVLTAALFLLMAALLLSEQNTTPKRLPKSFLDRYNMLDVQQQLLNERAKNLLYEACAWAELPVSKCQPQWEFGIIVPRAEQPKGETSNKEQKDSKTTSPGSEKGK